MVSIKKKFNVLVFTFLFILFCNTIVLAESEILFQMKPSSIPYFKEDQIFSAWNPTNSQKIRTPGLKILFFWKTRRLLS